MIPATVPLFGHTISVHVIEEKDWPHGEGCVGVWDPVNHQIHVLGSLSESLRYHTFFHELLHAALHMMNHKLATNEPFVDQLGGLLAQALTGATYPAAKRRRKGKSA